MTDASSLVSNPWLVGAVTTAVGIVVTAILTLRFSRKYARLAFTASNSQLVGPLGPDAKGLSVVFNGTEVPSASSAKIVLWNDGNQTLRGNDADPRDPLAIELKAGVRLLSLRAMFASDQNSGFMPVAENATARSDRVAVRFDHFKPGKGAAFEIVHTGTSAADLTLVGSFIEGESPRWVPIRREWVSAMGAMMVLVAFLVPFALAPLVVAAGIPYRSDFEGVFLAGWECALAFLVLSKSRVKSAVVNRAVSPVPPSLAPYAEHVTRAR